MVEMSTEVDDGKSIVVLRLVVDGKEGGAVDSPNVNARYIRMVELGKFNVLELLLHFRY